MTDLEAKSESRLKAFLVIIIAIVVITGAILSGCAQIKPEYDEQGRLKQVSSFKTPLMGDLNFKTSEKTTDPKTGTVTEKATECSTSTNADKVFNAGANLIKTGINEAEKAGALFP
jgi:hypothetical protein